MNLVQNGGFDGNLDRWTGDGTIDRTLGYPRLGCAKLTAGQSIESEAVGLAQDQLYTLHYFYRLATGATLTVAYGSVSQQHTSTPLDAWREGVMQFALDAADSDGVSFAASGGTCYVDSVTLLVGGLAIDRATLVSMITARLRSLVTEAGLSGTASSSGPNGDYTTAIDEALRAVGAVNMHGDPDITQLQATQINDVVDSARVVVLQALRADYALKTDVQLGPRRESRSQIAGSIDAMLGGGGSGGAAGGRVSVGNLKHAEWQR